MRTTKAQGLPLNVIILALLGLAVLVILIIILTRQTGGLTQATSCEARQGTCIAQAAACPTDKPVRSFISCKVGSETGICCLPEDRTS